MSWERARKPEQKAVRREAILSAARSLFSKLAYEEISLNAIAREAGISKPNVYRYFSTREEIFLAIFESERDDFVESFSSRLRRVRTKTSVAISRVWVETALKHKTLLDLLPQVSTSMEKNSSVEELVLFKQRGYGRFDELVNTLATAFPRLEPVQWATVLQCAFSMMAGLWPFSNPGDNVLEAMRHPDVNRTVWDFEPLMVSGLSALIEGMVLQSSGRST